jgi:hypothetical protein
MIMRLAVFPALVALRAGSSSAPLPYADPPFDLTRVLFSAAFSSDMVLQREPAQAAVFGTAAPGATVQVRLTGPGNFSWSSAPVPVMRSPDASQHGTWRVLLPARGPGFGYALEAACDGCPNAAAATLSGVGYGDVFLCSGQSCVCAQASALRAERAISAKAPRPSFRARPLRLSCAQKHGVPRAHNALTI